MSPKIIFTLTSLLLLLSFCTTKSNNSQKLALVKLASIVTSKLIIKILIKYLLATFTTFLFRSGGHHVL